MINLNDSKFENKDIKVFNNGVAEIVRDCDIKVVRKTAQDADNAPAYKIIISNETGEVNKGLFDNVDSASEAAQTFFVKEMKHLWSKFNIKPLDNADSYKAILDYTMKELNSKCNGVKVNVAVCYGTNDRRKKYLEVNNLFALEVGRDPWWNPKYSTVRLEATDNPSYTKDDVPTVGTGSESDVW